MQTIVLSIGGSIIVPDEINVKFIRKFRDIILTYAKKGNRIIIVTGGGSVAREYMQAARKVCKVSNTDLDWIGIQATKINAELMRSIFTDHAYEKIVDNPNNKIKTDKKIIIGSGWVPGFSSDKDAVLLAHNFGASTVINMTNVDYVYNKDPNKYSDALPIEELSWSEMKAIVGSKWKPGSNLPFDPIASKQASDFGLTVIIMNSDLNNFSNFLDKKKFRGTVIS